MTSAGPLWQALRASLFKNAARTALLFHDQAWSYGDLAVEVSQRATQLREAGVHEGDRVVLLVSNGPAYVVTDLSIIAVGAVKVPLSPMLSAAEVRDIAERVGARALVLTDDLVTLASPASEVAPLVRVSHERSRPAGSDVKDLLGSLPGAGPAAAAAIYFSGGTTGAPKGVVHSQQNIMTNLWAHLLEAEIARDERLLLTTPMAHAAGVFAMAAILRGASVRIEADFQAARFMQILDDDQTTWTFAVPTMIGRVVQLAEERGWKPRSLRTLQYGAAPVSPQLLERALDCFGPVLQQLYGQTEVPNYATLLTKEDHLAALTDRRILSSAGKAVTMTEIAICDDDGLELATGEVGEVCVRAPYVMTELWGDPEGYAARFHGDWLRTGDMGIIDADGYLHLRDRRHDMIVSGGMNVFSVEVERVLTEHDDVSQAAVIGVPDDDWGEAVCAMVVLEPGRQLDVAELRRLCGERLAAYKRPKQFKVSDSFPLTRYGKIDKKALRAPYWADAARAIN